MHARRPIRFLIVEHVATMRTLIRDLLKDFGYTDIDEADNAAAAWNKLRETAFDFVIADLDLPGSAAIALLRQIRADPSLGRLAVLLVADPATKESILAAAQAGASWCLVKPFTPAAFQKRLDKIVDKLPAAA